ncbi:MAG: T9SS type A sorting domain-containing protein [Bacteroidota bacterium]
MIRTLLCAVALATAAPTMATPVKFFGQDPQPSPASVLPASGASVAARTEFLSNLSGVGTEDFGSVTVTNPNTASATFSLSFAASSGTITATGGGFRARIQQNKPPSELDAFATSPVDFLKANGGLTLSFDTPIAAFGFYITDVEVPDTVLLTLTPDGGGAPVELPFTGIINTGQPGGIPGDGQVAFIGFIDTETLYTGIDISFPGTSAGAEAFGFDDMTVGDVGQVTSEQVTATQADIFDEPGWRLLGAPVTGVTVDALALQNLVQGVPAGNGQAQQQYPAAPTNLYIAYNGGGRYDYVAPTATGTEAVPGEGFWWYWYDQAIDPPDDIAGGGTSESVVLDDFALTALGDASTVDVVRMFTDNANSASDSGNSDANPSGPNGEVLPADDDFYMLANPFAVPFAVDAISVTGGTLQDALFAWDPGDPNATPPTGANPTLDGPGSYQILFQTPLGGGAADRAAVWQGLMAEVTSPTTIGGTVEVTYAASGRDATATPPFYGRQRRVAEPYVHLRLEGVTEGGAWVRDEAAYVRLRPDASAGWDRYDASKPLPPTGTHALIAPVGVRDGDRHRQAVLSLPDDGAVTASVDFLATGAGAYTLRWEQGAADTWDAELTDHATDTVVDLGAATAYAFTSESSGWTERFSVRFAPRAVSIDEGVAEASVAMTGPNPTASETAVVVRLGAPEAVRITVVDALGREVARLHDGTVPAGATRFGVEAAALAPGVYTLRVEGESVRASPTFTVIR